MKILADKYLYKLDELLPEDIKLHLFNPSDGFPEDVAQFDALLIRTVTRITPETLPEAGKLKFIGSATAGFDHVDTDYLERLGIVFGRSEGCNANAVGEYVITSIAKWAQERGVDLRDKKIGVVGFGNTGGHVLGYLQKLGVTAAAYDPPKADREPEFTSCSLDELLACDILTFHTPLTQMGDHPTFHMCGPDWLGHGFDLIINTARGGVVNEKALLRAYYNDKVRDFILDVWENEPVFGDETARLAYIATPHIAGYSKQAKWKASEMVIEEMCRFFGLERENREFKPDLNSVEIHVDENMALAGFLWSNSNIRDYDERLRELIGMKDAEKARKFAKLRSETETRVEFGEIVKQLEKVPGHLKDLEVFSQRRSGAE